MEEKGRKEIESMKSGKLNWGDRKIHTYRPMHRRGWWKTQTHEQEGVVELRRPMHRRGWWKTQTHEQEGVVENAVVYKSHQYLAGQIFSNYFD